MSAETHSITWIAGPPKRLQYRCIVKVSYDGGQSFWPRGPLEVHVAGNTYVLLMNGRYERKE